jgi:hypothetical protein
MMNDALHIKIKSTTTPSHLIDSDVLFFGRGDPPTLRAFFGRGDPPTQYDD